MAESIVAGTGTGAPGRDAAFAPSRLSAAVKDSIGSEFARHAARLIGANEWRTQSAIDLLMPAVLRRLARRSASPEGAAVVFAELGSPGIDSDLLATMERLLGDEGGEPGDGVVAEREAAQGLLGRGTGSIVFDVASSSGLTVDATWQLLALTSPLVHAALRDHVWDRGLDAEALRSGLASEYPSARSKHRYRLRRAAGHATRQALLFTREAYARGAAHATRQALLFTREAYARGAAALARQDRRTLVRGIVAVGAVIAISLWLSAGGPTTQVVSAGSGGAARLVADANGPPPAHHSAGADALIAFLSSSEPDVEYVFVLDGVQFEPTSATLRSASNPQLEELARVLADFPDARLTIKAYADGTVDAESRALAVRAAIAALGVQPSRMRHTGINGASRAGPRVEASVTKDP